MRIPIGIRITVDFAFKLVFGNAEHPEIVIHFLNAILDGIVKIVQVVFLNPTIDREKEQDKLITLDILAKDGDGRSFIIEMQTTIPTGMAERLVYYNSRLYSDQIKIGDSYTNLKHSFTICVLTESMFPNLKPCHLDFRLREKSGQELTDNFQIHLIELDKLKSLEILRNKPTKMELSMVEWWAYFIRYSHQLSLEEIEQIFPDKVFVEAGRVLEMISKSPEQKLEYDARMKFQADLAGRIDYARNEGLAQGRALGISEGEQIGILKGEQVGILKGEQMGILKGLLQGQERGVQMGQIVLYQEILGLPKSEKEELAVLSDRELNDLYLKLQRQFVARN